MAAYDDVLFNVCMDSEGEDEGDGGGCLLPCASRLTVDSDDERLELFRTRARKRQSTSEEEMRMRRWDEAEGVELNVAAHDDNDDMMSSSEASMCLEDVVGALPPWPLKTRRVSSFAHSLSLRHSYCPLASIMRF